MPFTQPTAAPSSPPVYSSPSHADLAAVAATVAIVGVLMAILLTWLILRLRRVPNSQPVRLVPKPRRLSHKVGSWDFADADPFAHSKEMSSPSHTPSVPPYTPRTPRASIHKDPTSEFIEPPPPAYCPETLPYLPYPPGVHSPC